MVRCRRIGRIGLIVAGHVALDAITKQGEHAGDNTGE
jgi:hypothetical protein